MTKLTRKIKHQFKNKRIAILGFGREGRSTLTLLRKNFPNKIIGILDGNKNIDLKDQKTETCLGDNYLSGLKDYNLIFRSPGISLNLIKNHINKSTVITSQTKLFLQHCPAEIIGVTGTKGKSTTTALIAKILNQKYKTHLVGNIGAPPLDSLLIIKPKDKVVFEMSSHQLSDLKKSPHVAVFLNLFPEHLDYYKNFNRYKQAKTNIFKHQNKADLLVFNSESKTISKLVKRVKAKKISYSHKDIKHQIPGTKLIGKFNQMNVIPAVIVSKYYKIPNKTIISTIQSFTPLPHRLEVIGRHLGITFINDSLATTPLATIKAIEALRGQIGTLIAGGFDRSINQLDLVKSIINNQIPTVILFPDTGDKIQKELLKYHYSGQVIKLNSMKQAVKSAYKLTGTGKICLMSPAAASFNMFKDYKDRGEQFKKAVNNLK